MRRSETMGADNCHCAVKITYICIDYGDHEAWEVDRVEVTRHCAAHVSISALDIEDCLDDPWDI